MIIKRPQPWFIAAGLLLTLFVINGCGTDGESGNQNPVSPGAAVHVFVSPPVSTIQASGHQQFTATVVGTSKSQTNWSVNGIPSGDATLGTISFDGFYSAPATISDRQIITIAATSVGDPASSGTAVVTLEPPAPSATGTNYYVNSMIGDDSFDGTAPAHTADNTGPWRTLRKAGLTVTAGATVHVADGIYTVNGTLGSPTSIETMHSGSASAWITYLSDHKWGARIINTNSAYATNNIAWLVDGNYQTIEDFDISGGPYAGIFVDGNHVQLIGNHLHNMLSTSCVNGSFIYVNSPFQYVDTIGNVMHDGGLTPWPSDCNNWHGIYYGGVTTGPVQYGHITNNIIYRVSGYGVHFWHGVSHVDVLNNLIFYNVHGGMMVGASDGYTNDYFNISNNTVIFNSNMFNNTGGPASLGWGIAEYVSGGTIGPHNTYSNNLTYGNHSANGWGGNWSKQAVAGNPTGVISGTITANPLLAEYQNSPTAPVILNGIIVFPGADYRPSSLSPAKGAADCALTPSNDIDGQARLQAAGCNIGPY